MIFDPHNRQYRQLAEALTTDTSRYAYLLIDPLLQHDFQHKLQIDDVSYQAGIIDLRRNDIPRHQYPRVVPIAPHETEIVWNSLAWAHAEQCDSTTEQRQGFGIGGWLTSSSNPTLLAEHLGYRMRPLIPGVGRKYFRWADRRVFEWMWPVLNAQTQRSLFGPINSWWTLDRTGSLQVHTPPIELVSVDPLPFTEELWQHAKYCEPTQALVRGWRTFTDSLPKNYLQQAAQAVHSIHALGVTDLSEIVLLGAYVLQIHPRLCTHPQMQSLILDAREQGHPLSEALAQIPDPEGWHALREDLTGYPTNTAQTQSQRNLHHG